MKKELRARLYWLLVILIIVAVIGVIGISVFSWRYANNLAEHAGGETSVDTLLSAGIGIIGIMIAVWTGLSISNVISRKDVDKLNSDIEAAKKIISSIDEYITEDAHIQAELFYVETSRNNWDPLLRYIVSNFPSTEEIDDVTNLFSDLTIIELRYSQVKSRHQRMYLYDGNLISLADDGIDKIETIKKTKKILHKYINIYLNYRKCGFNFFSGYCEKTKQLGVERFINAAQGYKGLFEVLNDWDVDNNPNEPDVSECRSHLANSIGESYSKIIQYYCEEDMKEQYGGEICRYAELAIKYCKMAVDEGEKLDYHTRSFFLRNLGAAYERVDKLNMELKKGHDTDYHKKIIAAYESSVCFAEWDDASDTATIKAAYLTYLSFLGSYFYEKIDDMGSWDLEWLKELNKKAECARSYFPWSQEIKVLYELVKRLYMRYYTNGMSSGVSCRMPCGVSYECLKELEELAESRKKLLSNNIKNERINKISAYIDVLISKEDQKCQTCTTNIRYPRCLRCPRCPRC